MQAAKPVLEKNWKRGGKRGERRRRRHAAEEDPVISMIAGTRRKLGRRIFPSPRHSRGKG